MLHGVGLEVMNPINAELKWQTVTKGKRSKKSIARSLNGIAKFDKNSPKRVGDFYESDCNKFNEAVLGQPTFDKTEHVPIKKRRRLLRSPSPQRHFPSPLSQGFYDGLLYEVTKGDYNSAEDFSGIELLAAAASMDDEADKESKEGCVPEDSSMPKSSDSSKMSSKWNESGNPLNNATGHANDTECSLALQDVKVDRRRWDLNTVMDSWDEPYEDSMAGNSSNNASNLKIEENKLKAVSPDGAYNVSHSIQESLRESVNDYVSNVARETFDQDADVKNSNQVLSDDFEIETPRQVFNKEGEDSRKISGLCGNMTSLRGTNYSVDNSDDMKSFYSPPESTCFLALGTPVQDGKSALFDNSKDPDDETFIAGSTDFEEHLEPAELAVKSEDNNISNEGSQMINFNETTASVGKVFSTTEANISQDKNGYDSPYEDGELRGSFLPSWEENEFENECVDYESDAADFPGFEEIDEDGSKGSNVDENNNEIGGNNESNAASGTMVEHCAETVDEENEDWVKKLLFDQSDTLDDAKVARMDKDVWRSPKGKLMEGQSSLDATDEKDLFFIQQCRPHRLGGSYSRSERDSCPEKYPFRYRPATQAIERNRYASSYQKIEGRTHKNITANKESRGFRGHFFRRSHVDRNESIRMPLTRGIISRGRVHYSHSTGRDFEEGFERRSRSRSRTRSPMMWHSRNKRHSKSPDVFKSEAKMERIRPFSKSDFFKFEAKMERIRVPFSKPKFESDYGQAYSSPPKSRWADDRTFGYNRLKHAQRFDDVGFSGRSKSDECFRPIIRPTRFSRRGGDGKFETNYEDRRREERGEVMRRGRGGGGNFRGREDKRV